MGCGQPSTGQSSGHVTIACVSEAMISDTCPLLSVPSELSFLNRPTYLGVHSQFT